MTIEEPGWELYRTFLAVLQAGSLSGAARSLGLTQPTVGRHVDALEAALGTSLFLRTQRGFSPTESALTLAPYARTMALTSAALLRAAAGTGQAVSGTVRLTASDIISVEVLPPILADLRRRYPHLAVELVPSNQVEDLLRRESDIAVRMVRPTQGALVARHIGDTELGLFAREDYLARAGRPESLDALRAHAVIGFDRETAFTRSVTAQLPWLKRDLFSLRTDSDSAGLAALRAGYGVGICQVGIARRDPSLIRVLPDAFSFRLETWVTMHENLRGNPRCQVLFQALAAGLGDYLAGQTDAGF